MADNQIERDLKINKYIADTDKALSDIRKNNSDIDKNKIDVDKALIEIRLAEKKSKWYEFSLLLAAIGVSLTIAKILWFK